MGSTWKKAEKVNIRLWKSYLLESHVQLCTFSLKLAMDKMAFQQLKQTTLLIIVHIFYLTVCITAKRTDGDTSTSG